VEIFNKYIMCANRDPFFIACNHATHEGYTDEPDYTLLDPTGNLILRSNETIIQEFSGDFMMLRYPEQRWLINNEKIQNWSIILTSERLVGIKPVLFPGAFEFFDHIETYGKFAGLHPTEELTIDQFFGWLGKKKKNLNSFSLTFQLAFTRISMISCIKMMTPEISGIEFWYEDGPNKSQTQIQIFAPTLSGKQIYDIGVQLQGSSLNEKMMCLKKKHEIDPTWEVENYNTYLASIKRLVTAPDFLAMGSGTLDSDSYDPVSFQPHPIIWSKEIFARSMDGTEPIRVINLKY
jgi:hypothetical protein